MFLSLSRHSSGRIMDAHFARTCKYSNIYEVPSSQLVGISRVRALSLSHSFATSFGVCGPLVSILAGRRCLLAELSRLMSFRKPQNVLPGEHAKFKLCLCVLNFCLESGLNLNDQVEYGEGKTNFRFVCTFESLPQQPSLRYSC